MRKAVFSGSFYPDNADHLKQQLTSLFNRFVQTIPINSKPYAIMVPHAGYIYSGHVAASAFSQISNYQYKNIIILGPSHRFSFNGISIDKEAFYDTPFGSLNVNQALCDLLRSSSEHFDFWDNAHNNEHSIEVECPFIFHLFKDQIPIIPIVVGQVDLMLYRQFAAAIMTHCKKDETLIIVSTDFSHFYDAKTAEKMDKKAIDYIHQFDFDRLWESQTNGEIELCGIGPTMILATLLHEYGIKTSQSLMYAHSGMVSGDDSSVVGYHSALFG